MILGLFVALAAFVADQLSKFYVFQFVMENGSPYKVFDCFNIVSAFNKGVSFSMFDNGGNAGRVILIVFALAVVAFLLHWMKTEVSRFVQVSLGFIVGGALGNVADRLRMGAVYDFLDFHYGAYHWPAFNLADTFICVGACLIILHAMFNRNKISLKEINK
ncbi:MAG: signal peptidase II [Alphaproteobacteria bacterium]|nr:signal peptidase II [Alphaproteobacteria bacterium]